MTEPNNAYFFVYLTTNDNCEQIDCGITGDLGIRLYHLKYGLYQKNERPINMTCIYLLHWERFADVTEALKRGKEIQRLSFRKKREIIDTFNPEWKFLNETIDINTHSGILPNEL